MDYSKERSANFLNFFWDLASDDDKSRAQASKAIIVYLCDSESEERQVDISYAIKRLIRGLPSSRQSARQGFASCLCQFLQEVKSVKLDEVITLLDENTKITGSMRGAEERDLIFGRLFGCLAIIRSGILNSSKDEEEEVVAHTEWVLNCLIELHDSKGWVREVVVESILSFVSTVSVDTVVDVLLPVIADKIILQCPSLADVSASQLMLLIGLQHYADRQSTEVADAMVDVFPSQERIVLNTATLALLENTLVLATAGFPKIHSVWKYLSSLIFGKGAFPMISNTDSTCSRVASLSGASEEALIQYVSFLDRILVSTSHEKKSVAFKILPALLVHTPAEAIPLVVSKSFVQLLVSCRSNKKHTLNGLAGICVEELVRAVTSSSSDERCRLALASTLVQFGGANFDSCVGMSVVGKLLEGLNGAAVASYITFLCGVAGGSNNDIDNEDQIQGGGILAAMDSLTALAKNTKISNRGLVCSSAIAVLIRICCFGEGTSQSTESVGKTPTKSKKGKTPTKGKKSEKIFPLIEANLLAGDVFRSILLVEDGYASFTTDIVRTATVKLLGLLSDIGSSTLVSLNGSTATTAGTSSSLMDLAMVTAHHLGCLSSNLPFLLKHSDSQDDEDLAPKNVFMSCWELYNRMAAFLTKLTEQSVERNKKLISLVENCQKLLGQSVFHIITSSAMPGANKSNNSPQIIASLVEVMTNIITAMEVNASGNVTSVAESWVPLFECCMELMAGAGDQSMKGIRDACKKLWTSILACVKTPGSGSAAGLIGADKIEDDIIGAVLGVIIGDDLSDEAGPPSDDSEDEESDDDDEEDEEESDQSDDEDVSIMSGSVRKESLEDDESGDNSDDGDNGDDDDDEGIDMEGLSLEHGEEADQALVEMIRQKQLLTKQGKTQQKRDDLLLRSRAIDIFEVIVHKCDDTTQLLPLFVPLFSCMKKLLLSTWLQSMQEGKVLAQRLRTLIEDKLCKKQFKNVSVSSEGDEESEERNSAYTEEMTTLCGVLTENIGSSNGVIRIVAMTVIMCLLKSVNGAADEDVTERINLLKDVVLTSFTKYTTKKKSCHIPGKLFDQILDRNVSFFVETLLEPMINACLSRTSTDVYLRAEGYRMLSVVMKRSKGLSSAALTVLIQHTPSVVESLTYTWSQLESVLANAPAKKGGDVKKAGSASEANSVKSKRLKPMCACMKELSQFYNSHKDVLIKSEPAKTSTTPKKSKKSKSSSSCSVSFAESCEQFKSFLFLLSGAKVELPAVIQNVVSQTMNAMKITAPTVEDVKEDAETDKPSKKQKKQKVVNEDSSSSVEVEEDTRDKKKRKKSKQ